MNNQNEIPNHFKRVEDLLRYRQRVLSSFNELPRGEVTSHICASTNVLFYKAIVKEMRSIVEAYDYEFGKTTEEHHDT